MVQTVGRIAYDLPHGSIVHHATGDFVVDRSDLTKADNGDTMIQPITATVDIGFGPIPIKHITATMTTTDSANSITI